MRYVTALLPVALMAVCVCAAVGFAPGKSPPEMSKEELDRLVKAYQAHSMAKHGLLKKSTRNAPGITAEQIEMLEAYQMELIRAGGKKGPPLPIPIKPEMVQQLVKEGALPDVGQEAPVYLFRCINLPLSEFLDKHYSKLIGKKVVVDKTARIRVTYERHERMSQKQAIRHVEEYLKQIGIALIPDGTNQVKAIRMKTKKAKPSLQRNNRYQSGKQGQAMTNGTATSVRHGVLSKNEIRRLLEEYNRTLTKQQREAAPEE